MASARKGLDFGLLQQFYMTANIQSAKAKGESSKAKGQSSKDKMQSSNRSETEIPTLCRRDIHHTSLKKLCKKRQATTVRDKI